MSEENKKDISEALNRPFSEGIRNAEDFEKVLNYVREKAKKSAASS